MTPIQTTTTQERKLLIPVPAVEPRTAIPAQNLRIPGPISVLPSVLAELVCLLINHRVPEIETKVILNMLYERDQLVPVSGQEHLSGMMVCIEHMGFCKIRDLFSELNCFQVRLQAFRFTTGKLTEGGA